MIKLIQQIVKDSNLSATEKIKRIQEVFSDKHITDTGLGYLVRLPNKRSKFFRYAPPKGVKYNQHEQAVSCARQLKQARKYKQDASNN